MIAPLDQMAEREPSPTGQIPVGHMSLPEMINFYLNQFVSALDHLDKTLDDIRAIDSQEPIEYRKLRVSTVLSELAGIARQYNLARTSDRTHHFEKFVSAAMVTARDIELQLVVLREALIDDIKGECFYHYSAQKVLAYRTRGKDWQLTMQKFRSTVKEIEAATDCYALGYNTASVFHLMRIAEYGLRALCYSLEVEFPNEPIEWALWQNLIAQISKKGEAQAEILRKGPLRDEARDFYSGAASHFAGFKDMYRNDVMHVRADYDEGQAWSAMMHVRDFMNSLSRKIGEDTKTPIQWS